MDAFEQIVAKLYEAGGYWTQIGYKVDLDKETKRVIGNPSMPRPEIDVLAYRPLSNEILIIECKNYLDSPGVRLKAFAEPDSRDAERFKIFHNAYLFEAVKTKLIEQLFQDELIVSKTPSVQLGLVASNIYGEDEDAIAQYFKNKKWLFVGPSKIARKLRNLDHRHYENDVLTIAIKILERNPPVTSVQMKELLQFLPRLLNHKDENQPVWEENKGVPEGSVSDPSVNYPKWIQELFQVTSQPCWDDQDYDPAETGKLIERPNLIEVATLTEIRAMLTYCTRGERFHTGYWAAVINNGTLAAILKRLEQFHAVANRC